MFIPSAVKSVAISQPEMQAQRGMENSHIFSNGYSVDYISRSTEDDGYATIQISSSSSTATSSPSPSLSPASPFSQHGDNYIVHHLSKLDTLAGIAIKYGVEVADIRRMNGLMTDIQMFAHKSLQIPLPGRHPPSPAMSNSAVHKRENTPHSRSHNGIPHSFPSFDTNPSSKRSMSPEGTEMSVYKSSEPPLLFKDETFLKTPPSDPLFSRRSKSRSWWNFISIEKDDINIDITEPDRNSSTRRPKTHTSEILLKEESVGGAFAARGKGLALRPKPGSRGGDTIDQNSAMGGNSLLAGVRVLVRKASSTANLIEFESGATIWPTSKWSLKADVVTRPVIDGPPKLTTGRRNHKAALD